MNRRIWAVAVPLSVFVMLHSALSQETSTASVAHDVGVALNDELSLAKSLFSVSTTSATAAFRHTPDNPTVNELVRFIDQSKGQGLPSWCWNFGDGTTSGCPNSASDCSSEQQNPTHRYSAAGSYKVSLEFCVARAVKTHCDCGGKTISVADLFLLKISKASEGSGRVTSDPQGIACGDDCSENYREGATVRLFASPAEGSVFSGWSGDCAGTSTTTSVTVNRDLLCVASFKLDTGTIRIEKTTSPATDTSFNFSSNIQGLESFQLAHGEARILEDLQPGTYLIEEVDPPPNPTGFRLTELLCDDSNSLVDLESRRATVVVEAGETVTCTFTNSEPGRIAVKKVTLPEDAADVFEFTGDVEGAISSGEQIVVDDLDPGSYAITELLPVGWRLTDITCDDEDSTGDLASLTASVRLQGGETVNCIFENTQDGTLVIEKLTVPLSSAESFVFTGDVEGEVSSESSISRSNLAPGTYFATEQAREGWRLVDISCDDSDSGGSLAEGRVQFRLDAGESIICTFTNAVESQCGSGSTRGMVAWWPLDEPAGSLTADIARLNDGWRFNTPRSTQAMVGGGLSFNGIDEFVEIPDQPSLNFSSGAGDFSISLWIKAEFVPGSEMTIVDKSVALFDKTAVRGYQLFMDDGILSLRLNGTFFNSNIFLADDLWHYVTVTVDRSEPDGGRWYLDGLQLGAAFDSMPELGPLENTASLRIGRRSFDNSSTSQDPGGHLLGTLDELELFDRALTSNEIFNTYSAGSSGRCKEAIHIPADTPICADALDGLSPLTICNHSTEPRSYGLGFSSLPAPVCGGTIQGPEDFDFPPQAEIKPRTCRTIPIRIGRPTGFVESGLEACYRVEVSGLSSGSMFSHSASVWDSRDACAIRAELPVYVFEGESAGLIFGLAADAATSLQYEILANPSSIWVENVVSLDGLVPGESVMGEVQLSEGEVVGVSTEAEFNELLPFGFHDVRVLESNSSAALSSAAIYPQSPTLLLSDRRFRIEVAWRDFLGNTGIGRAVPHRSDDSGLLWFFDAENWEMLVKVLDGCAFNDHFWVFAAATTNVEYTLRVTDTETGVSKEYFNPLGSAAPAITDVGALAVCADKSSVAEPVGAFDFLAVPGGESSADVQRITAFNTDKGLGCELTGATLCLQNGRFELEVDWRDFESRVGKAEIVPFSSDDSGLFWFFDAENWEMLVKVLDGCSINGHYWVFSAATTNVEYTLRVTDTDTGEVVEYLNPLGNAAAAITDIEAFTTCPAENPD